MAKITDPYLKKVAPQHRIRPKFMALLAAYLEKLEDIAEVLRQMDAEFDLEQAIGNQLDVAGEIVGVARLLDFQPYYAPALLEDYHYRMIIRAKISLNHWDGTIRGIQDSWGMMNNGYQLDVIDHQDMTMTLQIKNQEDLFEAEFIARGYLAPKPEGVWVNYRFVVNRHLEGEFFLAGVMPWIYNRFAVERPDGNPRDVDGGVYIAGVLYSIHQQFSLNRPEGSFPVQASSTIQTSGKLQMYCRFAFPGIAERSNG